MLQSLGGIGIVKSTEKLLTEITMFLDMDPDLTLLLPHWISNTMEGKDSENKQRKKLMCCISCT